MHTCNGRVPHVPRCPRTPRVSVSAYPTCLGVRVPHVPWCLCCALSSIIRIIHTYKKLVDNLTCMPRCFAHTFVYTSLCTKYMHEHRHIHKHTAHLLPGLLACACMRHRAPSVRTASTVGQNHMEAQRIGGQIAERDQSSVWQDACVRGRGGGGGLW